MKKYIFLIAALISLCAGFEAAAYDGGKFADDSVLVIMKPSMGLMSVSSDDAFEGMGIADVKKIGSDMGQISLFGMGGGEETLKLTLENPSEENVLETVEKLKTLPQVKCAEPDYYYRLADAPNDEYFDKQYALGKIGAFDAWNLNIDCSETAVAIIDSGMLMEHPDLAGNLWTNPGEIPDDEIDNDGNGYKDDIHGWDFTFNDAVPDDQQGHGTHVAGIVSALTDNGIGIASAARNAEIVPLKAGDSSGYLKASAVIEAIDYVVKMGFPIVNCSFADTEYSETLYNAMKKCEDVTLFVAAAGNSGTNNDTKPFYPASYDLDNIISVAASDSADALYSRSNYGEESVDIAAPGVDVWSTYGKIVNGVYYRSLTGTSMAAPMTAGAAAVIKAKYPYITPREIIEKLEKGVDVIDSFKGKIKTGGRLNVYKALTCDADMPSPTPTAEPSASPAVTVEPSASPTATVEPSASPAATVEPSASPAVTVEPSASPAATVEPNASPAATAEPSASPAATVEPSASPAATVEPSASPAATVEPCASPIPTAKPSASPAPTDSPVPTPTVSPTEIPKTEISLSYDADSRTLVLKKNYGAEYSDADVIKAAYDAEGNMTAVKIYPLSFGDADTAKISEIDISENERIFVWQKNKDNGTTMIPLSEVFVIGG